MDITDNMALITLLIAAIRALVVFDGLLFMVLKSGREIHWDRSLKIAFAEPFLLAVVVGHIGLLGPIAPMTASFVAVAASGALFSCSGLVLFAWSFVAYRHVGTGHYVDKDHEVVQWGPYSLVRHPMYCAAIFIWLGLALANADWAVLTVTFAYVVPAYYFYARDEERMMARALGPAYSDYAARVPMLFPRPLNIWE